MDLQIDVFWIEFFEDGGLAGAGLGVPLAAGPRPVSRRNGNSKSTGSGISAGGENRNFALPLGV